MTAREKIINQVGAVVLAAGQSRRMGTPKLVLPWGDRTVIEQVTQTLLDAGVNEIVVVTGGGGDEVESALRGKYPVKLVRNAGFAQLEMLGSLKVGVEALSRRCQALLVVLGDQPTILPDVVLKVIDTYIQTGAAIIIPSYQMRRGHPWLVDRSLWPAILTMGEKETMRDFLQAHADRIAYSQQSGSGIFTDIDTPEDYERFRPQS